MLGVLRAEGDTDAPLAPVPGLARLGELASPLREAGFAVTVTVDGPIDDLPALVDASAYRVVQEALTNVVRHAGPSDVNVAVVRSADGLHVRVEDDGRGSAAPATGGHGLRGMSERVTALGGTFEAAARPQGGFLVEAWLPLATRGGSL
jgi:signal transduction histidine kinase